MKTKNILLISLIVFFMTACFNNNPDDLEEGLLIMDFGQESLPPNLFYTIDLLGPTTRTLEAKSGDNLRVNVAVGTYDITITAYQNLERITPYMRGTTTNANVIAGVNNITINLSEITSVAMPWASSSGSYRTTQRIVLQAPDGATIYYTLDGSVPSTSSTQYTGGPEGFFFETSGVYTLKAIAVREGLSSSVLERTYTIDFGWTASANSSDIFGNDYSVRGIAYGDGKFVAVASRSTPNGFRPQIAYSTDGINWIAASDSTFDIPTPVNNGAISIHAITYGGGKFVIVGNAGQMAYSFDGINWTKVADSTFDITGTGGGAEAVIYAITYGGGKFVAGGNNTQMAYSSDGISWAKVADNTFNVAMHLDDILGIAYDGGKFVAVGRTNHMAYSSDGIKWFAVSDSTFSYGINAIAYGGGKFVAGGRNGRMAYSIDGIDWFAVTDSKVNVNTHIYAIAYGDGKFIAVGDNYSNVVYSTDGINWTSESLLPVYGHASSIIYGNKRFVLGQTNGIAYLRTE